MSASILDVASSSFNALLSPFTPVCTLARSHTCASDAARYGRITSLSSLQTLTSHSSPSLTPARSLVIDESTQESGLTSVHTPTARRLSPAAPHSHVTRTTTLALLKSPRPLRLLLLLLVLLFTTSGLEARMRRTISQETPSLLCPSSPTDKLPRHPLLE